MYVKKQPRKSVQFLRASGYLFALGGWLWGVLFYTPFLLESPLFAGRTESAPVVQPEPSEAGISPLAVIVSVLTLSGVLALSVYSLSKLPAKVMKSGEKLTKTSVDILVPVFSPRPIPPARKRRFQVRLTLGVQLVLAMLPLFAVTPLAVLPFPSAFNFGVTFAMIMVIVGFHALISSVAFLGAFLLDKPRVKEP